MATIKKISFGKYLRNLRESRSLMLKNVAEQIGLDTSLIAKIERNERQSTELINK